MSINTDSSTAGKLHLRPAPQRQQGVASYNGHLYITAADGDADNQEADKLWRVRADHQATAAYLRHELTLNQLRDLGEIEGIDFDENAKEMLVLSNRGKRIVLGMPKGFYPGHDREISEVYVYRISK